MEQNYVQRGYLHEDFRLFHLRGAMEESVDWHYHTFHKIIEFLGGESGYGVEGKQYLLQPGDLVLVPQGCIHRPEAEPNAPYERRILYLSPEFLRRAGGSCDLAACFDRAREEFRFVVHPADGTGGGQLTALEHAEREDAFGRELLAQSLLFQFLIGLNRAMADDLLQYAKPAAYDRKIEAILRYLSEHLTEPVSIDEACQAWSSRKTSSVRVMFAVFSPDCMADSTASGISASSAAPCRGVSVRLRAVFASSESTISKTRFSSVLSCSASDMETSCNAPASSAMDGSKIAASFCASSPEIAAE